LLNKSKKAYQRKIVNLEAELAETIGELDKSRHLLITQVKINDDYKKEVHLIQSKMEENKADYDGKMLEYAQLLDIRAARIKVCAYLFRAIYPKNSATKN
jgi:protein fantom